MPTCLAVAGALLQNSCCAASTHRANGSRRLSYLLLPSFCVILSALCGSRAEGQTSLTGQVLLNQKPAFDAVTIPTPTSGTYLIAMTGRLRGEYVLSVESPYPQTVHLIVNGNQFDNSPTIQILDNHAYQFGTMLSNFRVLLPSSNAVVAYLVMDVALAQQGTQVNVQYQGSAGYVSGFGYAGGTIPSGLVQVGGPVLAVNEQSVGIGTANPGARLEVNGGIKISPGSNNNLTFQDGTTQSTAWTGSTSTIAAGTTANFGRLTVGNSAPDGQGSASQGIVFTDTLNGTAASGQWTHAAIHSVGEGGYNGDLVFSTDGDGQLDNNPTEKMRIMYNGRVGIGTTAPQSLLHLRSSFWDPAAASQPIGNGNLTIEGTAASRSPSTGAAITFAVPAGADGTNAWDHGRIVVTPDNANNGDANGRMYLQTRYHAGSNWLWNNNLTLTSAGSVGVGTTGPQKQFSVQQSMNVDQADTNSGTWDVSFGSNSGEGVGSARTSGSQNQYGLTFYTGGQNRASITNGGNFGIATQTPAERLDVNGNIKISAAQGKLIFPDGSFQTTANASTISQSNGNTNVNATLFVGGGNNPTTPIQGSYFAWNTKTGDTGETDFINHRGFGGGGFAFYNTAGDGSTKSLLAFMDGTGNLGLGTANPSAKLEVNGNIKLTAGTGASITFADGSAPQTTAWTGTLDGGDYAESVDISGPRSQFEPGDLLVIDPDHDGLFLKSTAPYSTLVGGVYATKPGVTGRRQPRSKSKDDEVPMAMIGIVPTKVSTENGPVHRGDLLVSSGTPGFAMKGTDRTKLTGAVLGKALGSLESGTGVVEVLISLQ